jgi:ketosteroid isomerase-like protein
MKKLILVLVLMATSSQAFAQRPNIFAPPATASGPIADLVNSIVMAFNNHDTAYLQKIIAPDAVWLDEDGHHLIGMVWMQRLMAATPPRKLTITNLRVQNWDNAGWAGFNYVMQGTNMVKGTNSFVFKKTGNNWQIVLIHGAVDTAIVQH